MYGLNHENLYAASGIYRFTAVDLSQRNKSSDFFQYLLVPEEAVVIGIVHLCM